MFKVETTQSFRRGSGRYPGVIPVKAEKQQKQIMLDAGLRNLNNLKVTMGSSATGMTKLMN